MKKWIRNTLVGLGGITAFAAIGAGSGYWWLGMQGPPLKSQLASYPITEISCPPEISANPRCGKIKVPLDYSGKEPGSIEVGFVFYPALLPEGDNDTVLQMIDGGPGQVMSDDLKPSPMRLMRWQFRNRPMLFVDARGVGGLSAHLPCPVKNSYDLEANKDQIVAKCAETYGAGRLQYTSINTARDFDLVRRALGFKQTDLIAFSYGTALAPIYVALAPKAVRSIVLDGAYQYTPYANPYFTTFHDGALRQFRQVCERTTGCDPAQSLAQLAQVAASLRASPRAIRPTGQGWQLPPDAKLDPGVLVAMLTKNAGILKDDDGDFRIFYPLLGAVARASNGDWVLLERLAALELQENVLATSAAQHQTVGLRSTITCQEGSGLPWSLTLDPKQRPAALDASIKSISDPRPFAPFTPQEWIRNSFQEEFSECRLYPSPPLGKNVERRETVRAQQPRDIPVLILNGDLDLQTPHEDAREAAKLFNGTVFARFKHFNHVIMPNSLCAMGMVADFIRQRKVADANACLDSDALPYVINRLPKAKMTPDAASEAVNFLRGRGRARGAAR
jgi:pimeloyl-ACP methyl ester carboxylesterase